MSMSDMIRTAGWILTVAAAQLAFILGWTLAIGVGGSLLITAGYFATDWITGVVKWEHAYGAHLGTLADGLAKGFTMPVGAGLALWRFLSKPSRVFGTYSLPEPARVAVTLLCYALCVLLVVIPLYLFGGTAVRAIQTILGGGPNDSIAFNLPRMSRIMPLMLFAAIVSSLADQVRRS